MELKQYISILRKRLLLIIAITLLSTFVSALVSYFVISPTYKADISVIIGKTDSNSGQANYNELLMYQKLVKTYGELAKSRTVTEDVIKNLNLSMTPSQLQSMVSVAPKGDTEFITITVKSKDAEESMDIANQLAKSLKKVSLEVKKEDNVQLLDEALLPTAPDTPKPLLNMAIAFFLGIMISTGIVFLMEYLDNTVKSQEEVVELLGVPVIGTIPLVEEEE